MSTEQREGEQTDEQPDGSTDTSRLDEAKGMVEWDRALKLSAATIAGLAVWSLLLVTAFGSNIGSIAEGLVVIAPGLALTAVLHDVYEPLDIRFLTPSILFVAMVAATFAAIMLRAFRLGLLSDPVISVFAFGVLSIMFAPGPFLAAWATRRWFL